MNMTEYKFTTEDLTLIIDALGEYADFWEERLKAQKTELTKYLDAQNIQFHPIPSVIPDENEAGEDNEDADIPDTAQRMRENIEDTRNYLDQIRQARLKADMQRSFYDHT